MTCSHPIDETVLADYWLAALPQAEEAVVEEHLFGCDACGARFRRVIALAGGLRDLARGGCLRMVVSDAFLQSVANDGLRIREHITVAGGSIQCTVHAQDNLLVVRMAAALSGAARVDLSVCDERGVEQVRYRDLPVHAAANSVTFQESIAAQKAAPSYTLIARLLAFDDAGNESLVGEYTLHHTRSSTLD